MPGFVDPHTHLVWAGDRAAEFEMRLQGKSYMEIMAAGGGIQSTVNATRAASVDDLLSQTRQHARAVFAMGTTSAEAKSGYGLELESELKQLDVLLKLDGEGPLELFPTFLGAHAVPKEYQDHPEDYVTLICAKMLPEVKRWWTLNAAGRPLPFVDVFCEKGAFDLAQSRRILETAKGLGFPLKIHADEFENLGGAALAAEFGAARPTIWLKPPLRISARWLPARLLLFPCPARLLASRKRNIRPPKRSLRPAGCWPWPLTSTPAQPGAAACSSSLRWPAAICASHLRRRAAVTINAAAAVGQSHRPRSTHPGKQADLLALSVPHYRHLAYQFGGNLVGRSLKEQRHFPAHYAEIESARQSCSVDHEVHGFRHIERVYHLCEQIVTQKARIWIF